MYYDHYAFALTWPREFCSEKTCKPNWQQNWDGKSFTIHGFWPSSKDMAYMSCFKDHGVDPYCNRPYTFNQNLFSSSELADLNKYWPQYGSKSDFWAYEWDKHGTCFLKIFKEDYASTLSEKQLFKKYFTSTIDKVKALKLTLQSGTFKTKGDFAKKLGLGERTFNAACGRDNELDEIRICYDIYHEVGQEVIINCPPSTDPGLCKFPMVVK